MKQLKVIGFQGASRRFLEHYFGEDALIINGHVGYEFEDDALIYGFHPPEWSIVAAGGSDAAFQKFKEHEAIPGTFQDDTEIFYRAYELSLARSSKMGIRLEIYVMTFSFDDEAEYDKLHNSVRMLYNSEEDMPYSFPPISDETPYDNCATVLRHFGLRIINFDSHKGEMRYLIQVFQEFGELWKPEQEEF
jgi:hypothetical protein